MLDDLDYIKEEEGKYFKTSLIIETKTVNVVQNGDDHGYPKYKETVLESNRKVIYKNKIKIS